MLPSLPCNNYYVYSRPFRESQVRRTRGFSDGVPRHRGVDGIHFFSGHRLPLEYHAVINAYTHCFGSEMNYSSELPRLLRAAYFGMHRASDGHFSRHGVTADQFVLLACLAEEHEITQQELARRASSDPSTVRAMLVLLEGRGLVARQRHPADNRARVVTLTAKGRRLFDRLRKTSEPIRMQMLAGFSADEARSLVGGLRRVINNMAIEKARRSPQSGI